MKCIVEFKTMQIKSLFANIVGYIANVASQTS